MIVKLQFTKPVMALEIECDAEGGYFGLKASDGNGQTVAWLRAPAHYFAEPGEIPIDPRGQA